MVKNTTKTKEVLSMAIEDLHDRLDILQTVIQCSEYLDADTLKEIDWVIQSYGPGKILFR